MGNYIIFKLKFKLPKYAYGSCILANLSNIELDGCYLPIPRKRLLLIYLAYTYAPFLIGLTKKLKKMKINPDTNKLEKNNILKIFCTFDHRYLDGYFGAKIANEVK